MRDDNYHNVKKGIVQQVDTDHVLIVWSDNSFAKVDFQDSKGRTFKQGDKVSFYPSPPGPDHWWINPQVLIDPV